LNHDLCLLYHALIFQCEIILHRCFFSEWIRKSALCSSKPNIICVFINFLVNKFRLFSIVVIQLDLNRSENKPITSGEFQIYYALFQGDRRKQHIWCHCKVLHVFRNVWCWFRYCVLLSVNRYMLYPSSYHLTVWYAQLCYWFFYLLTYIVLHFRIKSIHLISWTLSMWPSLFRDTDWNADIDRFIYKCMCIYIVWYISVHFWYRPAYICAFI